MTCERPLGTLGPDWEVRARKAACAGNSQDRRIGGSHDHETLDIPPPLYVHWTPRRVWLGCAAAAICLILAVPWVRAETVPADDGTPPSLSSQIENFDELPEVLKQAYRNLDAMMAEVGPPELRPNLAAEQAEDQKDTAEARMEALPPYLRPLVRPEHPEECSRRQRAIDDKQRLMELAAERRARREEIEQDLDEIAQRLGLPRRRVRSDGGSELLVGEIDGNPIYITAQNLIAGASISVDELWPQSATPWQAASTGLDLTGAGITLGLWEVEGAVRTTHDEFGARVTQVDDDPFDPIPLDAHATGVAGTMTAGGTLSFLLNGEPANLLRGVAYSADVHAYDTDEFSAELSAAAAGTPTTPGLRLSNHSWGAGAGWSVDDIVVLDQNQNPVVIEQDAWVWRGALAFAEDWQFGYYTPDLDDGSGCTQVDAFLSDDGGRHLMVYSAGNDRLEGPGAPTTYYYQTGEYEWLMFSNPSPDERDWLSGDGDTGAYDSGVAPGTAKNVLTVGACLDVYHLEQGAFQWGYGPGAAVTLAPFSGCGPTDDGRIKPDVVAVGLADPFIRDWGIFTTHDAGDDYYWLHAAGTSFAAPAVTGGFALALERRGQLYSDLDPETDALRGSTLRALAIHTADDVGSPGPDFQTWAGACSMPSRSWRRSISTMTTDAVRSSRNSNWT